MDFEIHLQPISQNELSDYVKRIRGCDLDNLTKGELINILHTVRQQTEHAQKMGWL